METENKTTEEIVKEVTEQIKEDSKVDTTNEVEELTDTSDIEIDEFLPQFEPIKLSGKNLAMEYVSAFNTGMNIYQCVNYLQGYVYTLVTAMNETIDAWNTVVPLIEEYVRSWTDDEFDFKWEELRPVVIQLCKDTTIETFNKAWAELKPVVIQLVKDTTDEEFDKKWEELKPTVIQLCKDTTIEQFNESWEELRPVVIQLCTDTTIEQFNKSWAELKPQVIELVEKTTSNKFNEEWTKLKPDLIQLAKDTTDEEFDKKWAELKPTVIQLCKDTTIEQFNETWEELKPTVIQLCKDTTDEEFDAKWTELKPQVIELVEQTTINKFNESWKELKPQIISLSEETTTNKFNEEWTKLKPDLIQLCKDTTDEEFDAKWDELKPQVIELAEQTTTNKFNEEWTTLKPDLIQLTKDTTDEEFETNWSELKPQVISLSEETTTNKFNEEWTKLKPQVISLSEETTTNKFNEEWTNLKPDLIKLAKDTTDEEFDAKWNELKPDLIQLCKDTTITQFNETWESFKPSVIELVNTTTSTKFDEKWTELQPTIETMVNTLVENAINDFKGQMWDLVTQDEDFPYLIPENFGAVGDGTTDDTEAFKKMYSSASYSVQNLVTKPVLLSSGKTYVLSSAITITFNGLYGIKSYDGEKPKIYIKNDDAEVNFTNIVNDVYIKAFQTSSTLNFLTGLYSYGAFNVNGCSFINLQITIGKLDQTENITFKSCIFSETQILLAKYNSNNKAVVNIIDSSIDSGSANKNYFMYSNKKDNLFLQLKNCDLNITGYRILIFGLLNIKMIDCNINGVTGNILLSNNNSNMNINVIECIGGKYNVVGSSSILFNIYKSTLNNYLNILLDGVEITSSSSSIGYLLTNKDNEKINVIATNSKFTNITQKPQVDNFLEFHMKQTDEDTNKYPWQFLQKTINTSSDVLSGKPYIRMFGSDDEMVVYMDCYYTFTSSNSYVSEITIPDEYFTYLTDNNWVYGFLTHNEQVYFNTSGSNDIYYHNIEFDETNKKIICKISHPSDQSGTSLQGNSRIMTTLHYFKS